MAFFDKLRNLWGGTAYSSPYQDQSSTSVGTGIDWAPPLRSSDGAVLPSKPYVQARLDDLSRTDGMMAGAISTIADSLAGELGLRLDSHPNEDDLGITYEEAEAIGDIFEREWAAYNRSSQNNADASRQQNYPGLCRQGALSYLHHGEILAVSHYRSEGKYRTSVRLLDPNRLVTPTDIRCDDDHEIRAGIKINLNTGEPVEYYIAKRNPADKGTSVGRGEYDVVPAKGRTGRRNVIHITDTSVEGTRGISPLASALDNLKQNQALNKATLDSAIFQNLVTAVIKSEANYETAMGVVGGKRESGQSIVDNMMAYQKSHLEYFDKMKIDLGSGGGGSNTNIVHLLPREDLEFKSTGVVNRDFEPFSNSMQKSSARGLGMSLEKFTGDYAGISYSASQTSQSEYYAGLQSKRARIMDRFAQAIFELFVEEILIHKPHILPEGVSFYSHRDALCAATWMAAPRAIGDVKKLASAQKQRLEMGVTTKAYECNQYGLDWREVQQQLARERRYEEKLGLLEAADKKDSGEAATVG